MATKSNKWWWEGYAALIWLLLMLPFVIWRSPVTYYLFMVAGMFAPIAAIFCISALRRGSPREKQAAMLAVLGFVFFLVACTIRFPAR